MTIFLEKTPAALLGVTCVLLAVVPVIIAVNLVYRLASRALLPDTLPWAGVDANGGGFARLKANLRSVFHMESLLDEGYSKASTYRFPTSIWQILVRDMIAGRRVTDDSF